MKPLIQCTLDNLSWSGFKVRESACHQLASGFQFETDLLEVGTPLILHEGLRVFPWIREMCPGVPLIADQKPTTSFFGNMVLAYEPEYATIDENADLKEMEKMVKEVERLGNKTTLQIELTREIEKIDMIDTWKNIGIQHIIYHGKGVWRPEDIANIDELLKKDVILTLTGKVTVEDLEKFAPRPLFAIICGSYVRDAANPSQVVRDLKARINELWA